MTITYEDVTPTLIANTTMQKMLLDGVHKTYKIIADDGYVLHDNRLDYDETDGLTGEVIEHYLGYTAGSVTCPARYDFTTNPYEFYAVLRNTVPESQIFGDVTEQPEIM